MMKYIKTLGIVLLWTAMTSLIRAQSYELDASHLRQEKIRAIDMQAINPTGISLSVNNRYFEKNGRPWFPLMGEMHYWRFPEKYWEEELIKMKSAGIQIVSTYIYWGAHEKTKGQWNWTGRLNLKYFIQLCRKNGLYVWLRPGPYINADVRGRGFPDWIDTMSHKRSNDPAYLMEVKKYFSQVGIQTHGLYFKEGGPIIGIQLENEYASGSKTHIGTLKKIAIESGMQPVYWSVTANSIFRPETHEVLPMQGAYSYRGWEPSGKLTNDFLFGTDQWIMGSDLGGLYYPLDSFPRATCEQGAGMQETHRSRFIVNPASIEAHAVTQYGRGINMLGYFMFQGGTQFPGTEVPFSEGPFMPSGLISYNYQAPLSEFGEINNSYRYLKLHHLFLNDFGNRIVTTTFVACPHPILDPSDTTSLRFCGRFNQNGEGFIFVCNTQNYRVMPPKKFSFQLLLPNDERMEIPQKPATIKNNEVAIWPINFKFGGINFRYITAQVLCKVDFKMTKNLFLYETNGIVPEICLDATDIDKIDAPGWKVRKRRQTYILTSTKSRRPIIIHKKQNKIIIRTLTRADAEHCWKYQYKKQEYLIISNADLLLYSNKIEARNTRSTLFQFESFPLLPQQVQTSIGKPKLNNKMGMYAYKIKQKSIVAPIKLIPQNDSLLIIQNTSNLSNYLSDVLIKINFRGNLAEATLDGKRVADQLFIGKSWTIGMKRFLPVMKYKKMAIKVTGKDYYSNKWIAPKINSADILPVYKIIIPFSKDDK